MSEIGGYFEWEMPRAGSGFHPESTLLLKSGRSCLSLILRSERPEKVFVPYYICEDALAPFRAESVPIEFYGVDANLEIVGEPQALADDERLLYVDYFGLKSDYVRRLEERYREQVWLDHSQAFFHVPIRTDAYHFNSARKFFGVPDGAYLYCPNSKQVPDSTQLALAANQDFRLEHLMLRLEGQTQEGYRFFQENERLNGGEPCLVSDLGREMLRRIDYSRAAEVRRKNYERLHSALGVSNRLSSHVLTLRADAVPFCYPYHPRVSLDRRKLWKNKIYVPILWKECTTRVKEGYQWEKTLAMELLPLPVDQRYNSGDMDRIVEFLAA